MTGVAGFPHTKRKLRETAPTAPALHHGHGTRYPAVSPPPPPTSAGADEETVASCHRVVFSAPQSHAAAAAAAALQRLALVAPVPGPAVRCGSGGAQPVITRRVDNFGASAVGGCIVPVSGIN